MVGSLMLVTLSNCDRPLSLLGVRVRPGDWIVADRTGVVVVPIESLPRVVALLRQYDEKETKMVPLIKETKSMGEALRRFNRY